MKPILRQAVSITVILALATVFFITLMLNSGWFYQLQPLWFAALLFVIFLVVDRLAKPTHWRWVSKLATWAILCAALYLVVT
ncbi:MAG: hypothetical protein FWF43_06125 [Propionibacteriaceae bacterium]|nr:hypothetical protein [Propionibacteriaceae bacterium]